MIIYYSQRKIDNLLEETGMNSGFFYSAFNFRCNHIKIGSESGPISAELSKEKKQKAEEIKKVLKSLKSKGKLIDLSPDTTIKQLSFIRSSGTLKYVGFKNGFTASTLNKCDLNRVRSDKQFFDDDMLYFKINISHNKYDSIITACTVKSIQVFGSVNLRCRFEDIFKTDTFINHPNSADPGILYSEIPVEFIVWIIDTNPNDRSIKGSPVIIYC